MTRLTTGLLLNGFVCALLVWMEGEALSKIKKVTVSFVLFYFYSTESTPPRVGLRSSAPIVHLLFVALEFVTLMYLGKDGSYFRKLGEFVVT